MIHWRPMPILSLPMVLAVCAGNLHAADLVCFEAEATTNIVHPMRIAAPEKAARPGSADEVSQGKYVEIPEGAGYPPKVTAGEATWTFEIPAAGRYYLWCRARWDNECGNSISMSIDDAKPFTFGQDATYESWHWVRAPRRLAQLELTQGTHTLQAKNREDGVRIDQILLVRDKRYVPVGVEDTTP